MSAPISFTFAAPGRYLSMNDRDHWRTKARRVKAWRIAANQAARSTAYFVHGQAQDVHMCLDVPDSRHRDPMNYFATVKAVVDGMTDAGCWEDDDSRWVTTHEPTLRVVGRKVPLCVTVTLTERAT